jgi:signal transduction histidine kinase
VTSDSRSSSLRTDDELRLPRPPGVFRRFWARHPLVADIVIAGVCLLLSFVPAGALSRAEDGAIFGPAGTWVVIVLLALACISLVVRRRWPLVPFIAALLVAHAYLIAPVPLGGPLLLFATYAVAVYRSSRAAIIGLIIGLAALAALATTLTLTGAVPTQLAWNAVVAEAVTGVIGGLIGANVGNRRRYIDAVIDRSRQLLVERDQQARIAAVEERARIARELHDIVSHSLTVVVALAEGASATPDRDRARAATDQVAATARGALTEMRAMLGVLRDGDGAQTPLAPVDADAVATAVAAARGAGFPVTVRTSGHIDAPVPVSLAVGRIVQEGLTNAMRHAPDATRIDVAVDMSDAGVVVHVRNDGVRGPRRAGGYGIRGLQERVDHVGGTLEAGPTADGWMLRAELPIAAEEEDA